MKFRLAKMKFVKVKFKFCWCDFRIGFYYEDWSRELYFCPLPMLCFKIRLPVIRCTDCKKFLSREDRYYYVDLCKVCLRKYNSI